jgi:hypothetical protein
MTATRHQPQPVSTTADNNVPGGQQLHAPTRAEQRTARVMGAWFLGTFVFSIPAFWFYNPLLNHPGYVVGSGQDTRVAVGALLEICLAVCGIATAVVIYPIVKKVSASTALGYIASRTVESILILVGVLSLMSIVALRHNAAAGAPHTGLVGGARALLAIHGEVSLLGPQFCAGFGNGILLGYLMWRSKLLPRPMVLFGLIGGPLALLAGTGVLLGAWNIHAGLPVAMTVPEMIWEFSLSVWLLTRGFRPSPVLTGEQQAREHRIADAP